MFLQLTVTSLDMYSPHIAKEGSYSCLLQLSNIMPLPSVQCHLSEACSYVSNCPAGISYLYS